MRVYDRLVCSNGKRLRANYMGETESELASQQVDRDAPETVTITEFQFDNFLWSHLDGGLCGVSIQLQLLTDESALAEVFSEDVRLELAGTARVQGRSCQGVLVGVGGKKATFWIDKTSYLLRQLVYSEIGGVATTIGFQNAEIDRPIDSDGFRFTTSQKVWLVRRFVVPPQPLNTDLFGEIVEAFTLGGGDSDAISRESLTGQVSLLLWFNDHTSSWAAMEMFNHIYTLYQDNPRVRILGVWAEGNNMSHKKLAHLLNERNIDVPIVRDIHAVGKSVFAIPVTPTLIILDPRSRLQIFEVGMNSALTRQLPTVIDRIVDGSDLAAEILQNYERELLEYQQHM